MENANAKTVTLTREQFEEIAEEVDVFGEHYLFILNLSEKIFVEI